MRQLLLLRHAKSCWDDPTLNDHDRPLDAEGQAAASRLALPRLGLQPDLVLVSTARRTRETLERLPPLAGNPEIRCLTELYLASPAQILDVLGELPPTTGSVLVIAHNPGLHDLAMILMGSHAASLGLPGSQRLARGFPTAALAEFSIAGSWQSLPDTSRLIRFLTPLDLQTTTS